MMKIGNEDTLTNAPLPRLDYLLPASQAPSIVATGVARDSKETVVVVTVTSKHSHIDDAQDELSGWSALSGFIFGYITEESKGVQTVGLFKVTGLVPARGQRRVVTYTEKQES
jgi:hypothetical protein